MRKACIWELGSFFPIAFINLFVYYYSLCVQAYEGLADNSWVFCPVSPGSAKLGFLGLAPVTLPCWELACLQGFYLWTQKKNHSAPRFLLNSLCPLSSVFPTQMASCMKPEFIYQLIVRLESCTGLQN